MTHQERTLTPAMEDYLRAIYDLSQEELPVHTTSLARAMNVAPASVTGMLKRLATLGLVNHERYGGAVLTESGERVALQVMRHHRLIETYLAEALGVSWDEVHQQAHKLEHHISPEIHDRMDEALGFPERDPHGSPIPPKEGPFVVPRYTRLTEAEVGSHVIVREVLDEDGEHLRLLDAVGLRPDAELDLVASSNGDSVTVLVDGKEAALDPELAASVFVEPLD